MTISPSWREKIRERARGLRENQTKSELLVWDQLRNRQCLGKKFLRQHPIIYYWDRRPFYFIADFYCAESKLMVELDGSLHEFTTEYDQQRDSILNEKGLKILRIKNDELENIPAVIKKIQSML